jgi:hypothetical protein
VNAWLNTTYYLCVQTSSEAHPAFCAMGTGGPFPVGKAQPGHDADHSPPSSAEEVKNEQELYLLSPQAPPWRVAGSLYLMYQLNLHYPCNFLSVSYPTDREFERFHEEECTLYHINVLQEILLGRSAM